MSARRDAQYLRSIGRQWAAVTIRAPFEAQPVIISRAVSLEPRRFNRFLRLHIPQTRSAWHIEVDAL